MNIAAIIASIMIAFMGFAGGGGSSSGGGGGGGGSSYSSYSSSSSSSDDSDSGSVAELIIFGIFVAAMIIYVFYTGKKNSLKDHNTTSHEKSIHTQAQQIFESYQSDWSNFNYNGIKTYTTDYYYEHASLMLDLLQELHRVNKVSNLKVSKVILLNPVGDEVNSPCEVRVAFLFSGLDEVIDTTKNQILYKNSAKGVTETWNFIYDGKTLKLDGISQPTESARHLVKSLAAFAREHHLFYSPDWGRYCLPARGLIFGGSSMKIADINNHIIGRWGQQSTSSLIQLYTYAPRPDQAASGYYIVGQINVPKEYLGVIVKSRKFKAGYKPDKSYEKFELEWNEFNDRYDVYAASRDALPAFELLNPKFMEYLYSKNPSYNLEVVDNIIYIYAHLRDITEADYAVLLEVLQKAYDELKM